MILLLALGLLVFGELALWYADVRANFTARSSGYSEVMQIKISSLLHSAKRDRSIRHRYRSYRDAMRNVAM